MRMAYSIWVQLSNELEAKQAKSEANLFRLVTSSRSSFSGEDQPSNQIAFYLASKGMDDIKAGTPAWDDLLKKCGGAIPDDKARDLLRSLGGLGLEQNKNYGFDPKDYDNNPAIKGCCGGPMKRPAEIFSAFKVLPLQKLVPKVIGHTSWYNGHLPIYEDLPVSGLGWNNFRN